MDRLLVSAAHKSSGKTTITLGLCAALAAQGLRIQPFKKGPDYIDPMWLAHAAGRACYNLDPYLMDAAALERCFTRCDGRRADRHRRGQQGPVRRPRARRQQQQRRAGAATAGCRCCWCWTRAE